MKRIALITTHGFADMLELARQHRPNPYALCTPVSDWATRMPPALRLQTCARMDAHGRSLQAPDTEALLQALQALAPQIDAVAVCLLFS